MSYKLYRWDEDQKRYRIEIVRFFEKREDAIRYAVENHQIDGDPISYNQEWEIREEFETELKVKIKSEQEK